MHTRKVYYIVIYVYIYVMHIYIYIYGSIIYIYKDIAAYGSVWFLLLIES